MEASSLTEGQMAPSSVLGWLLVQDRMELQQFQPLEIILTHSP